MKKFNTFLLAVISICSYQLSTAQTGTLCGGNKGPNLLGARGTFSAPFITNNTNAAACLQSGSNSYNPNGNVGNKLEGCSAPSGNIYPCSDYNYTDKSNGMQPEFTYSLLKIMGDASGSNCLHTPIWKAKDHTGGDGSYFMAVNGAPNQGYSPIFYQIKNIPVCTNATYEFSAWVINMMPAQPTTDDAAPNISFVVNGVTIGNSGPIPYDNQWHKVGGQFTATSEIVNLQVINATQIAGGNDLGLDDISINVCESRIVVDGPNVITEGNTVSPQFTITDNTQKNTWYKWELSSDGGITFDDITNGDQATFVNGQYKIGYEIDNVVNDMNGYTYRLVVSTSQTGLANPDCIFFNDYTLRVASGGPLPIQLSSFDGTYSDGVATLKWQTSQELNNDRFELFRSFDGNNFELAATVAGAGTSYTTKNYSYQDRIASSANSVYYKLKQIDKNGKFSFSSVIKLSLSATTSSFQLFPNPVVNNFTASFTAPRTTTATLLIRNSNGQTVYSKSIDVVKGSNAIPVNNAPLTTGMYYVTIANDDFNFTGKLQKR
jgi:Secretion system C-terminal sorting domain